MPSINTNKAALQALQALNAQGRDLRTLQDRVTTGLKVASARDDGSTWAIAQRMRGEAAAWSTVDESLTRGQAMLDLAAAGAADIIDLLTQARQKAAWLQDGSLDATSRGAIVEDLKALVQAIDRTAKAVEFNGLKPLADNLVAAAVTTSTTGYSVPAAPLTPPSLAGSMAASGGGSQTVIRSGGAVAGRIDLYMDAYGYPDVLEIWQSGVRVAATGQPYAPGGGPVGAGAAVSGQTALSFDYDPLAGQTLEFRFNENVNAVGSVWDVAGVTLQAPGDPLPLGVVTTNTVTAYSSSATTYDFLRAPDGSTEPVSSRPMTAEALGLDAVDWNDPFPILGLIDTALTQALGAAAYFGERQRGFTQALEQNAKLRDTLEAGVGNLVDADLARESARLEAGKTRQQLAMKALAIANAAPQMLLKLFKGG